MVVSKVAANVDIHIIQPERQSLFYEGRVKYVGCEEGNRCDVQIQTPIRTFDGRSQHLTLTAGGIPCDALRAGEKVWVRITPAT